MKKFAVIIPIGIITSKNQMQLNTKLSHYTLQNFFIMKASELKTKTVTELREIAKTWEISNFNNSLTKPKTLKLMLENDEFMAKLEPEHGTEFGFFKIGNKVFPALSKITSIQQIKLLVGYYRKFNDNIPASKVMVTVPNGHTFKATDLNSPTAFIKLGFGSFFADKFSENSAKVLEMTEIVTKELSEMPLNWDFLGTYDVEILQNLVDSAVKNTKTKGLISSDDVKLLGY